MESGIWLHVRCVDILKEVHQTETTQSKHSRNVIRSERILGDFEYQTFDRIYEIMEYSHAPMKLLRVKVSGQASTGPSKVV